MKIALPGFEPGSLPPKGSILDHYTTGLYLNYPDELLKIMFNIRKSLKTDFNSLKNARAKKSKNKEEG